MDASTSVQTDSTTAPAPVPDPNPFVQPACPTRAHSTLFLTPCPSSGAVLLLHALVPAILEADEEEDGRRSPAGLGRLLDSAGAGRNGGSGGGQGGGGQGSGCDMGEYYRRVLLLDPANTLLLRNFGKYLHEVEGDLAAAEGCYARALLACPGDTDLLSL